MNEIAIASVTTLPAALTRTTSGSQIRIERLTRAPARETDAGRRPVSKRGGSCGRDQEVERDAGDADHDGGSVVANEAGLRAAHRRRAGADEPDRPARHRAADQPG